MGNKGHGKRVGVKSGKSMRGHTASSSIKDGDGDKTHSKQGKGNAGGEGGEGKKVDLNDFFPYPPLTNVRLTDIQEPDYGYDDHTETSHSRFSRILNSRLEKIQSLCHTKGYEYGRENRYHNFYRAAEILRTTPESALLGFMTKHFVSICDMVDDLSALRIHSVAEWSEKIGDLIVYSTLLEGLINERANK